MGVDKFNTETELLLTHMLVARMITLVKKLKPKGSGWFFEKSFIVDQFNSSLAVSASVQCRVYWLWRGQWTALMEKKQYQFDRYWSITPNLCH